MANPGNSRIGAKWRIVRAIDTFCRAFGRQGQGELR